MALSGRAKAIIFGAVVLVALAIIVGIVVHHSVSRNRLCENGSEVFYEDPDTKNGTCLRSGTKGPCGTRMVLMDNPRDTSRKGVGVCGCDTNHFDRPMVYHPETNECYFIFTTAFCAEDQWLTITKGKGPTCDRRLCPKPEENDTINGELVPLKDNRCVKLGSYDKETCNGSQVIKFHKKRIYPSCNNLGTSIGSVGVPSSDCAEGYYSTDIGHCQPDFDFD